jgi:hypothetical protein
MRLIGLVIVTSGVMMLSGPSIGVSVVHGWITKHRQRNPSVYEIGAKSRLRVGRLA